MNMEPLCRLRVYFFSSSKRMPAPSSFARFWKYSRILGSAVGVMGRPYRKFFKKKAVPPIKTGSFSRLYISGQSLSASFTKSAAENSSEGSFIAIKWWGKVFQFFFGRRSRADMQVFIHLNRVGTYNFCTSWKSRDSAFFWEIFWMFIRKYFGS